VALSFLSANNLPGRNRGTDQAGHCQIVESVNLFIERVTERIESVRIIDAKSLMHLNIKARGYCYPLDDSTGICVPRPVQSINRSFAGLDREEQFIVFSFQPVKSTGRPDLFGREILFREYLRCSFD
jgi:hypothetical protein